MGLYTLAARLLGGPVVVVECRRCGTTVDPGVETCPACERGEFSRYEIPGSGTHP